MQHTYYILHLIKEKKNIIKKIITRKQNSFTKSSSKQIYKQGIHFAFSDCAKILRAVYC